MTDASNAAPRPLRARKAAIFALIVLGIVSGALFSTLSLNHDSSWYLIATRRFLEGGRLYVDIVEINPPLSFYLTVPGLWLADIMGWSDRSGFVAYVTAIATLGNIWAATIVLRARLTPRGSWLLVGMLPIVTLLFAISEYGQREHLMMGFTIPYFVHWMLREEVRLSTVEQALLGLWAFFGFALKPYFYAAPAVLAAASIWRDRSLRGAFGAANLALAFATIAYVAFILVRHPEYLATIVPIANDVYHSAGLALWRRWAQPAFLAVPFLVAMLVGRDRQRDRIGETAALIALGFLVSYFLQFRGWNYHVIPAAAYLFLASVWLAVRAPGRLRDSIGLSILFMLACAGTLGHQLLRGPYEPVSTAVFSKFLEGDEKSILVLSTNVGAAFPFVNETGATWASRYPVQWYLPGAVVSLDRADCTQSPARCERLDAILELARGHIASDIQRYAPDLVYIDERADKAHFEGVAFDYVEFLQQEPGFDELWSGYRRVGKSADYRVYRKVTAKATGATR